MKLSEKTNAEIDRIPALLRAGTRALVTVHQDPDMDAIGSALAWAAFLEQHGMVVDVWAADSLDDYLTCLPNVTRVYEHIPAEAYDSVWVLDSASFERIRHAEKIELVAVGAPVVNIDHHADNTLFGDLVIVEPVSSVGEFLTRIIQRLGGEITQDMATCLYSAISYDTGRFLYSNTTATTLRAAADLVDIGLDLGPLGVQLYESTPAAAFGVIQVALAHMVVDSAYGIVYTILPKDAVESSIRAVDFIRQFKEAQLVAVFKVQSDDRVRVNLRSKNHVDVNRVAHLFGGGGHPKAAGIVLGGDPYEVAAEVVAALRQAVANA